MTDSAVGARLAQARRLLSVVLNRDVAQDEIAVMAGLAPGSMSQWEKGHKRPSRDTLAKIVKVLHDHGMNYITVAWLDYGEGSGPPVIGNPNKAPSKPTTKRQSRDVTPGRTKKKEA